MENCATVGKEKLAALFDAGTFVQTGAFVKRADGDMTGVICGYGAIGGKLTYLGEYYGSPAILDEKIHMYLAEDLSFGETHPDEDEFIETVRIPLAELVEDVMAGRVPDGKTQIAALRVARLHPELLEKTV